MFLCSQIARIKIYKKNIVFETTQMVSLYGTFLAIVILGAISSMFWIELAGSESLLARRKSIKRPV